MGQVRRGRVLRGGSWNNDRSNVRCANRNRNSHPFDHFVKRELRCRAYVRYVDDSLLLSHSKAELWRWKSAIAARLATLRLTIHPDAQPKPVTEGIPFLGFIVFPHRRRLKRRKGIHFARHLRGLVRACEIGLASLEEVNAAVRGWVNHVRYANTVGLRKAVLGAIRIRGAHSPRVFRPVRAWVRPWPEPAG